MKTKKEFKYFTIFTHEKEEAYLREQHKQGWKFLKISGLGIYHFEECDPEDVVYQLDFNEDSTKHKEEYLQMFADCGWEYIDAYVGYSYFRKPVSEMNEEEEIFSDDSSRLAMMQRVYKGKLLPLFVIFSACLVPQFAINMSAGRYALAGLMGGTLLIYLIFFFNCAVHYYRLQNKQ